MARTDITPDPVERIIDTAIARYEQIITLEAEVADMVERFGLAGSVGDMGSLLRIAEGIRRALERIAFASGWLLVVMAAVICRAGFAAALARSSRVAIRILHPAHVRRTSRTPSGRDTAKDTFRTGASLLMMRR